jgi:hypothetical protein
LLPIATHPDSVPFLLVRDSSSPAMDDDPATEPDARKAVRPRLPPPRANVLVEDLPSVIVEEPLPLRAARRGAHGMASTTVELIEERIARSQPTLLIHEGRDPSLVATAQVPRASRTGRVLRGVVAVVVALGALGALGGAARAFDLRAQIPRAVVGLLQR